MIHGFLAMDRLLGGERPSRLRGISAFRAGALIS